MDGHDNRGAWATGSGELPADVRNMASVRLATLAGVVAAVLAVEALVSHGMELGRSNTYPGPMEVLDLLGVGAMVVLSLAAFFALRGSRWTASTRHAVGLTYLVCIAYLLSLTDHADYFWRDGHPLHSMPAVALLIVISPVIVPMRAGSALALGLAMALTGPLALQTLVLALDYEQPSVGTLVSTCPYVAALLAAVLARIVHQLGVKLKQARQLGSYTLVEKIGEGGMGSVYRAQHAMLRRPTAVKLLPPEKVGARSLARFEKEVQLTAMLTHPNTVTVFDYGRTPDGIFYYAMELLDGATLGDIVAVDGPQSAARTIHILSQVSGALAEAHAVHLIHRDIKPANIMLSEQGGQPDVAKVLDFGLVRNLESADGLVTKNDAVTGTPQYLAPEAVRAPEAIGPSIDIYALGAVGYFLLTGEHVFGGTTVVEVCAAHLHDTPTPPSQRLGPKGAEAQGVPAELEALILRCLSKDPADRPQSATALQSALAGCPVDQPWTRQHANAWWEVHRAAVLGVRKEGLTPSDGWTMDVERDRCP